MVNFGQDIVDNQGNVNIPRLQETASQLKNLEDALTETVQDAAGAAFTDSNSIDLTYDDGGNAISADVIVDGSTVEIDASSGLQVKDGGITAAKLDNSTIPMVVVAAASAVTTVGGAAQEDVTVSGLASGDIAVVSILDDGTNNVTIASVAVTTDTLSITFSGDPGNDAIVSYIVVRAVV